MSFEDDATGWSSVGVGVGLTLGFLALGSPSPSTLRFRGGLALFSLFDMTSCFTRRCFFVVRNTSRFSAARSRRS